MSEAPWEALHFAYELSCDVQLRHNHSGAQGHPLATYLAPETGSYLRYARVLT